MTALRPHAEDEYAEELALLAASDDRPRPPGWRLSPSAVVTYLLGDGAKITPKYVGPRRLMEVAVSTLVTDRALLLLGVPGTAKTWVSEHLAAAISGDSTLLVQGTAGTAEEAIRYGWNYARLLADGPSEAALVPSPVMRAMRTGTIARRARTDRHSWQLSELCRAAALSMPSAYAPHVAHLAAQLDQTADVSRVRPVADLARTLTFRHEMNLEFE